MRSLPADLQALLRKLKPGFDTPLVVDLTDEGYIDRRGRILNEEQLERMASRKVVPPSLPKVVVVDLRMTEDQ